jgi:hypothetical protein
MAVSKMDTKEGSVKVVKIVERSARHSRIIFTIAEYHTTVLLHS